MLIKILSADHVFPVSGNPISDGAVAIEGRNILAVGKKAEILHRYPDGQIIEHGSAAILPGFVNCHSHLEITAMRGLLEDVEHDFKEWLLRLTSIRANDLTEDSVAMGAILGVIEGVRAGVTTFGDIGRLGRHGMEAMLKCGVRGILYQETEFAADERASEANFELLIERFESLSRLSNGRVSVGISPHATYTVSKKLFGDIAAFSIENSVPLAIHAAETENEDRFLRHGEGFFADHFAKFEIEWKCPESSPIKFLESTGILEAKPLLVHCVRVDSGDIEVIRSSGSNVAHCPKSNAKFGHGYAPLEEMMQAGIGVGLGSDSVASNNLADMIEESRFAVMAARNRPGSQRFLNSTEAIELATIGGARAMGLGAITGSLEAGKRADIAVVSLTHPALQPLNNIENAIVFAGSGRDVIATYVDGELVYADGKILTVDESEVDAEIRSIAKSLAV